MSKKLVIHDKNARDQDYAAVIARQGHSKDRIIQSSYEDLIPSRSSFTSNELARPSDEQVNEETLTTQQALDKIVQAKISATQAKAVAASVTTRNGATYVRYKSNSLFNDGKPMERIIKIVDKQKDPMLPPSMQIKKAPAGPPSPPAPILHEPSAKLTAQDRKDWYIPPAISNWKNQKGFTIAIDKRMSYLNNNNDTETQINENFGNLSEALEKAEQDAREEIKIKNELRLKLQERETQEREAKLRELAQKARSAHGRGGNGGAGSSRYDYTSSTEYRAIELSREERRRKAEREIKLSREQRFRADSGLAHRKRDQDKEPEFDSRLYHRGRTEAATNVAAGDDDDSVLRAEPVQFERDELVAEKNKSFGLQNDEPSAKRSKNS